jgi:hypothetical protein
LGVPDEPAIMFPSADAIENRMNSVVLHIARDDLRVTIGSSFVEDEVFQQIK